MWEREIHTGTFDNNFSIMLEIELVTEIFTSAIQTEQNAD